MTTMRASRQTDRGLEPAIVVPTANVLTDDEPSRTCSRIYLALMTCDGRIRASDVTSGLPVIDGDARAPITTAPGRPPSG
jgi:hypothetical protein